jgi:phosphoribosylformylglycinamidine synthase
MASPSNGLDFAAMSDEEILRVLSENKIGLTPEEARKVQAILARPPTLTEAIVWGIQGSEHCSYRSSKKHLRTLPIQASNVMLGVGEDAGIVHFALDKQHRSYGVILGHESHNHPSQVVPFEGAATGIGGMVRDIIVMGGRAVAVADPLRFGQIDRTLSRQIANGVVEGIAGYGNPLGVPNLAGDTYFDESFNDNCLVNVVCLGALREDEIIHSFVPPDAVGWDIIVVGKPTDQSGMGGAAFASLQLKEEDKEANKGAVQEPNPFLERHIAESTYTLFKKLQESGDLDKVSFKDMGAGGIVCASVEQVERAGLGAEIDLALVHTTSKDLPPAVVACAETQERFCWICHPSLTERILDHYNKEWDLPGVSVGASASLVGKVTVGNYRVRFGDEVLVDAPAAQVTEGVQYDRAFSEPERHFPEPSAEERAAQNTPEALQENFLKILGSENIASRLPIFENYDKVVQGQTVFEPGMADAGLLQPFRNREEAPEIHKVGAALSVDSNPRYGRISPYWAGVNAVVEGMRNVAAVGATPWAVTDCLNFGNPENPEQMWELVESIRGIKEALEGVGHLDYKGEPVPVVSGNVSLYNFSQSGSIAPSPIIGTLGRIEDTDLAVTMQFKQPKSRIYLIGKRKEELGGSEYYKQLGFLGMNVPKPDFKQVEQELRTMVMAVDRSAVLACHDISDGGLAITLAEMMAGGRGEGEYGLSIDLSKCGETPLDTLLFSETGGFVVEVSEDDASHFEGICARFKVEPLWIGATGTAQAFSIFNKGELVFSLPKSLVVDTWLNGLRNKLNP